MIKGTKHKEKSKKIMKKAHKGEHHSLESEFKKGHTAWNKGKKLGKGFYPPRNLEWLKEYQFKSGKLHPNWKNAKSRPFHGGKKYIEWRMKVFIRDNFTCQFSGIRGGYLEAHHIKSWVKFPELRYKVSNGITLSQEYHKLANKIQRKNENIIKPRKKSKG